MPRTTDRSDCSVRALAAVTGEPYASCHALLKTAGRRDGCGFHLGRWIEGQCAPVIGEPEHIFGWSAEWHALPAIKGQRRATLETVAGMFPTARVIAKQAHHFCAVVEGIVMGEPRRPGACVYGVYVFTKA